MGQLGYDSGAVVRLATRLVAGGLIRSNGFGGDINLRPQWKRGDDDASSDGGK